MIHRVKGTQDFLDMTLISFVYETTKKHLERYNFSHIDTPILEPLELFQRSLGQETDVVSKEMYVLENDPTICLRPEATASCMRAFVNNAVTKTPWKVFMWGSMFRHERPQKGRYREFHQISMEVIGSSSIMQDVRFILMLDRLFHETFTLDTYALLINFLGCKSDRLAYREVLRIFLEDHEAELCATCLVRKERNIMRVFDCKSSSCQQRYTAAPFIADHLCSDCSEEWQTVQHSLENASVSFSYKPTLVRGLDYYDKTVFEFVSDELGAQNAFCGGGRYNTLAKEIGAKQEYPALGASLGVERMVLLLDSKKEQLPLPVKPLLHIIIPLTAEQTLLALLLADELGAAGLCTDLLLENESVKSKMRQAHKLGAHYALLVGPDEQAKKVVTVKQMVTGQEDVVHQEELVSFLRN